MDNKELKLTWDFVNNTDRNIFLTGKAGTGKTTFLHQLKTKSLKRMVVVAPTGVAAINAKGVTIHSFFQMPFGPIMPNRLDSTSSFSRKFSKTKINIIKSLDLLVIDEISMVRADLLDGIDTVLRRFRDRDKVFGGVQVLMIGDIQQLSPVVKGDEWQLLKPYYNSIYFFSSRAYLQCNPISIELKHIYRQDNPVFIKILNEIRTNNLSSSSAIALNKRFLPDFKPKADEEYVFLTTHNSRAEKINSSELDNLEGKAIVYSAKIEGKFPKSSYPNREELVLKVGAQVMFIKNDSSSEKRYYNGKIGKVIFLDEDNVIVKCPDDDFNITVSADTWENTNYTIDPETNDITENRLGSYSQMPLRLAWSITIHKSQGLTFEKAIVDSDAAFAHGQTYVALSRCKSLGGLVLRNKIDSSQIINDTNVIDFNDKVIELQPDSTVLKQSKVDYQLHLISELFNFYGFLFPINRILAIYYKNKGSIEGHLEAPINLIKEALTNLLKVSQRFQSQLKELSNTMELPEENTALQERFIKAITYFKEQTYTHVQQVYEKFTFTTDNQKIEKDILKQLDVFEELVRSKLCYFQGLAEGFDSQKFIKLRAQAVFLNTAKDRKSKNRTAEGTTHMVLFESLRELRNAIAEREDLIHYQIFTQKALYEMCETLPTSTRALKGIGGMGKVRVAKYGNEIIEVIKSYCEAHDIETSMDVEILDKKITNRKKGDSKKESLALFKSGKSIADIAHERELNENTILGHLASFIVSGDVKITDLMSGAHYKELKAIIPKLTFENLSDLKHQVDEKYSYGELRLVLEELSK